jgi:hypothetical protein
LVIFENLRDQVVDKALSYWDSVQETSLYMRLSERYAGLSNPIQNLIVIASAVTIALILFLIPYSYYSDSTEQLEVFQDTAFTIKALDKVNRSAAELQSLPRSFSSEEMRSTLQQVFERSRILPEQIASITTATVEKSPSGGAGGMIWKNSKSEQVVANLKQLTLLQIVALGRSVEMEFQGMVFLDLAIKATNEDPHYFDVSYTFASFSQDEAAVPPADSKQRSKGR